MIPSYFGYEIKRYKKMNLPVFLSIAKLLNCGISLSIQANSSLNSLTILLAEDIWKLSIVVTNKTQNMVNVVLDLRGLRGRGRKKQ